MSLDVKEQDAEELMLEPTSSGFERAFRVYRTEGDETNYLPTQIYVALVAAYPDTQIGVYHTSLTTLQVRTVRVSRDTKVTWRVRVSYKTPDVNDEQESTNPLDRDPEISWGSIEAEVPITKDFEGNAILNVVGRPFLGLTEIEPMPVLRVKRNESSFGPSKILTYKNKTNSDPFAGVDPGQALMTDLSADRKVEYIDVEGVQTRIEYWEVVYEITFKGGENGWKRELLEADVYEFNDSGDLVRIKDANGEPISDAVALDEDGKKLASGGTPIFKVVQTKAQVAFSGLGISV